MSVWRVRTSAGSFQVTPRGVENATSESIGESARACYGALYHTDLPFSAILDIEAAVAKTLARKMGGTATLIARGKPLPKGTVI